jgi:hypothetical protein
VIDPPEGYATNPTYLAAPNFFGVSICFDPYKSEIVMDSPVPGKGGDGGCAICGGDGAFMSYLPYATCYRNGEGGPGRGVVSGDFTVARRIKRL